MINKELFEKLCKIIKNQKEIKCIKNNEKKFIQHLILFDVK